MKSHFTDSERKARRRESHRKWRAKSGYDWNKRNPEKAKANRLRLYYENHFANRMYQQLWSLANPKRSSGYVKKWKAKNPDYFPDYYKENKPKYIESARRNNARRMATDPEYKIRKNLRIHLYHSLKDGINGKAPKVGTTMQLLGCAMGFFMEHLKANFKPGMTFNNYGPVWHIDHVKPCDSFDMTDPLQQSECFHWTNLQPLFGPDNIRKSNKIIQFPIQALSTGHQNHSAPSVELTGAIET